MTLSTAIPIKNCHAEALTLLECPCLRKVDKKRANYEYITDDFEHIINAALAEDKKCKTKANQVHPVKADVVIFHKSDTEHIVVTMGELFPFLGRQHCIHKWECASISSPKIEKQFGPWLSTEHLNDAVEDATKRAQDDIEFKARQVEARNKMFAFKEELDAV